MSRMGLRDAKISKRLPVLSRERLAQIGAEPIRLETHARLVEELDLFDTLEFRSAETQGADANSLRVVAWNLERCKLVPESASLLARSGAQLALLSELDYGMARSKQLNTAYELSQRLDCSHAFGVEYLELGLGNEDEREAFAGRENHVSYHGGGILSRVPLRDPALVRLDCDGKWFDDSRGERRVGGRIAVLSRLRLAGQDVAIASVHLEVHAQPEQRAQQMSVLLEALDEYAPGAPALIGGDLNSVSMTHDELFDVAESAARMLEDPDRLWRPVEHEPLFECARKAGFDWNTCNVLAEGTYRIRTPLGSMRTPLKLDWFLTRGLEVENPEILESVDPETSEVLSDHEAIAITIRPEG